MHGLIDHSGSLQARAQYNWIPVPAQPTPENGETSHIEGASDPAAQQQAPVQPRISSISKLQSQINSTMQQHNVFSLEHEHNGSDYSLSFKAVNMNPFDKPVGKNFSSVTGIFSASYLQSITRSLAIGTEFIMQRQDPSASEKNQTYCIRWAPPPSPLPLPPSVPEGTPSPFMPVSPKDPTQVFTATWAPGSGLLHSTYWRRLNQRLEVVAELQMLLTGASRAGEPGRREGIPFLPYFSLIIMNIGIATVGFKLDTLFATIRTAIESSGKLSTVLEEKVTPNLSFQVF